jgi:hypothetical protein
MAKGGKVDFSGLEKFKNDLKGKFNQTQVDAFIDSCAKELAARLLAKVIKRTPVGDYSASSGKKGGTLRRGWTGGKSASAISYANDLKVRHFGGAYVIEIINPIEYASYVEFGHRTRGGKGWVEGKFMLTISEQEIKSNAGRILESKLKKKLGECFK